MGGHAHATQPAAFRLRRQSAKLVRNWYYTSRRVCSAADITWREVLKITAKDAKGAKKSMKTNICLFYNRLV
jgi:hypothetical protein